MLGLIPRLSMTAETSYMVLLAVVFAALSYYK